MGRRSRQRVRGEARNELIRQELEPLAPGEVPRAIKVAATVAALIAVFNPVAFATGYDLPGQSASWTGVALLSGLMVMAAVFMWRLKYWAVLGFQALLAVTCITHAVALPFSSNLEAVVYASSVTLAAGTLFWFLVRAMARIQMPERPNRLNRHG